MIKREKKKKISIIPFNIFRLLLSLISSNFLIINNFLWLCKSFAEFKHIIRSLHTKFGLVITLHISLCPSIFVAQSYPPSQIQNAAVFVERPSTLAVSKVVNNNQHNINAVFYGPT
ncbi:hypothetical protein MANES_07G112202v8 [Manihot esculenta]|uniref:Uncharacterized protein n=1 Tax=Manihot esculenta TaxID=3983 RepID=A0ACB7HEW1_MANES|nr:hypothetical protein MANES_07G112202v8 [Manihot esculenta]